MAKITLSRLFEVSKYLTTTAGQELKDALIYISEFVEVTTRSLRNGLTFRDNFDTRLKEITIRPDVETIVLTEERRRVKEVVIRRAVDATYYVIDNFGWKYNNSGDVVIKVGFTGSPAATQDIRLEIMFHFG